MEKHADDIAKIERQQDFCKNCQGLDGCRQEMKGYMPLVLDTPYFSTAVTACRHEKQRRQQVRAKRFFHAARVPMRYAHATFKDYRVTNDNKVAVNAARWVLNNNTEKNGLFLYGPRGTGKTMLASIIANEKVHTGKDALFIRFSDFLNALRESYKTGTEAKVMQLAKDANCLILDDLGAERVTDWTAEKTCELMDARYNEKKQTVITTNYGPTELARHLSFFDKTGELNTVQAERIMSRISAMCERVYLGGEDWRQKGAIA